MPCRLSMTPDCTVFCMPLCYRTGLRCDAYGGLIRFNFEINRFHRGLYQG